MNAAEFETISVEHMDDVAGGVGWKAAAKFAGKKVLGPIGVAYSAYEGTKSYMNARDQGKSFGASLWEGAKGFLF